MMELSKATLFNYTTVRNWSFEGVPDESADRVCIAAGIHPGEVWPDLWWSNAPTDEPCSWCGQPFPRVAWLAPFCRATCRTSFARWQRTGAGAGPRREAA